jgi:diguanylate cyclase (GGDEF)-like protein
MNKDQAQGLALACDLQGKILQVLWNDLNLAKAVPGQLFFGLVDSASRAKAMNFLTEIKTQGALLDWEMSVPTVKGIMPLHFAGGLAGESLLITAAMNGALAARLYEDMFRINNEQTNMLRAALKDKVAPPGTPSDSMYDEISRLNNELVSMQRELAGKNAELTRLYAELQKLAITDPLTGLYNRRGFFEKGDFELNRAKRYGHPLSAIMFDLDHFKNINDTYGHSVGDQVLKETAARLIPLVRNVDIFGRYGGEEFAILLPETKSDQVLLIAERLRRAAGEPINTGETIVNITISLGVSVLKNTTPDVQDLLRCADQALYQAKESGRDRVCLDQEINEIIQ